MAVLKFLLSLFFWVYIQVGIALIALCSYPAMLLPNKGRSFNYWLTRQLIKLLFSCCRFKAEVISRENIPLAGRTILIANKPDLVSTFALIGYFPRPINFAAEPEMFAKPFLGRLMKAIGCFSAVRRGEPPLAFAGAVLGRLKKGELVLLYPRNLRRHDDKVGAFETGELKAIELLGAELLPVIVTGTGKIIPPGTMFISPGQISIEIAQIASKEPASIEALFREKLED